MSRPLLEAILTALKLWVKELQLDPRPINYELPLGLSNSEDVKVKVDSFIIHKLECY